MRLKLLVPNVEPHSATAPWHSFCLFKRAFIGSLFLCLEGEPCESPA